MGKKEWVKWLDWVVALNSAYNALLGVTVLAGVAFSIPFLTALAPQYGPIAQAVAILGTGSLFGALLSIIIGGLFAWTFYGYAGKEFPTKDDLVMSIVKFVAILTLLAAIATLSILGFVLAAYVILRLWRIL